jgi:hypothetical protein
MDRHGLEIAIAQFVLGDLLPEDLPPLGQQLLCDNFDSPSLRQLAASSGDDSEAIVRRFRAAMDELGVAVPPPSGAGLVIARSIAEQILAGQIAPHDGARRIWWDIYIRFPQLKQLTVFVGLASEYEDDEQNREYYATLIVESARELLTND